MEKDFKADMLSSMEAFASALNVAAEKKVAISKIKSRIGEKEFNTIIDEFFENKEGFEETAMQIIHNIELLNNH
jgi:hypothetical protein